MSFSPKQQQQQQQQLQRTGVGGAKRNGNGGNGPSSSASSLTALHDKPALLSAAPLDPMAAVDQLVAKPVLGSDGAKRWQEFTAAAASSSSKNNQSRMSSIAPTALPLKAVDRKTAAAAKTTTTLSLQQERNYEQSIRKETGAAPLHAGYSHFRNSNAAEDAAVRKQNRAILQRKRPENKEYYIHSKTWQGWKFDYVFTTREGYGTGYFWDGMDSLQQLLLQQEQQQQDDNGDNNTHPPEMQSKTTRTKAQQQSQNQSQNPAQSGVQKDPSTRTTDLDDTNTAANSETTKKKKKRKLDAPPLIVDNPTHPLEQVAAVLHHQAVSASSALPPGWHAAQDPFTGKPYYYHATTGERTWDKPTMTAATSGAERTTQLLPSTTTTTTTTSAHDNDDKDKDHSNSHETVSLLLPAGWKEAQDPATGKPYYYHAATGKTVWDRPNE